MAVSFAFGEIDYIYLDRALNIGATIKTRGGVFLRATDLGTPIKDDPGRFFQKCVIIEEPEAVDFDFSE